MSSVTIKVPHKNATIVVTKSGTDQTVVAHGRNIRTVLNRAARAGARNPVLAFVPLENVRYIY
ncbi:MAG: hypothetical protein C0404_04600 [Verrucomicrobia bacterium]|nr:hypothetical protein [Verrucomicrobiota bacterium]